MQFIKNVDVRQAYLCDFLLEQCCLLLLREVLVPDVLQLLLGHLRLLAEPSHQFAHPRILLQKEKLNSKAQHFEIILFADLSFQQMVLLVLLRNLLVRQPQ